MTLKTVIFRECDRCGAEDRVGEGYKPVPLQFDGPAKVIDLCKACCAEVEDTLSDLLSSARSASPSRQSKDEGEFVCECGAEFSSKPGLAMHLGRSKDNHPPELRERVRKAHGLSPKPVKHKASG
jgi:hypothetical protein